MSVTIVEDPLAAVLQREVELRILPSLWSLRGAVIESTLEFSIIRWRNALPQQAAQDRIQPSAPMRLKCAAADAAH